MKGNIGKVIILLVIFVALIASFIFTFFTATGKRHLKNIVSNTSGGLDRVVTVYDYSENKVKTYEGKIDIEDYEEGSKIKFDLNGKRIIIYNSPVIIEEK
jgi:hypothetical protein